MAASIHASRSNFILAIGAALLGLTGCNSQLVPGEVPPCRSGGDSLALAYFAASPCELPRAHGSHGPQQSDDGSDSVLASQN